MMNNYNKKFMLNAIRLAKENVENNLGGPFGAVIVKDGDIISTGVNRVTKNNDPTAHSEILAIREACQKLNDFQLNDCQIYTTCEPCPMCLSAIYWARIGKIYYAANKKDAKKSGFDDSHFYDEIVLKPYEREINMEQHHRNLAIEIFRMWDENEDVIRY